MLLMLLILKKSANLWRMYTYYLALLGLVPILMEVTSRLNVLVVAAEEYQVQLLLMVVEEENIEHQQ
jgi:hypothetical protein